MIPFLRDMTPLSIFISVVDIAIVSYGVYRLFLLIRGTRAVQLIKGIILLLLAVPVSNWLHLSATHMVLKDIQAMLIVAIPVVFQPELRRALEQLGQGRFFAETLVNHEAVDVARLIDEVVRAAERLSRSRTGALIVIERQTGLNEYAATGTPIDAVVTAALLENIFVPNTPLHDGACIVRGNRVVAAAAFLPLTDSAQPGSELGSRHRAALGISEQSDAIAVAVSEETGWISLAIEGRLYRRLEDRALREMLGRYLQVRPHPPLRFWHRGAPS
ncbi:MAG: diadenylate cyclase CdaA [Firmicutes bacterium]|nr:diadenylate cyclase CdaA [Bacillota bacterium]